MRRSSRALAIALAAVAGLIAPASLAASAPRAKEVVVQRVTLTLVDDLRPTPANGTFAGAPERTLETVVSFPKGASKKHPLPLVVFATGFGGTATNYADLYDHWVRAGYVVAAPTFPLSSENAPGGEPFAGDLMNQPADVSFVLDEVLRLSDEKGSEIAGLIDPDRIGLAGKSLGAITVLDLMFVPESHDDRFQAVIAMTGLTGSASDFTQFDTPLLLIHGDADTTVPFNGSRDAYDRAQPPKFLVTIFGGTHGSAFGGGDSPSETVVHETTVDFLDAYVKGKSSALKRLERDGNVSEVAALESSS